jgi:AcrR family transcriptional regulator
MSTGETRKYQEHRDRQRESLLEAAGRLFAGRGIDAVSMADIATAARVTRATVYNYFPNKQEVAWALVQSHGEQLLAAMPDEVWSSQLTGAERVELMLDSMATFSREHPSWSLFAAQFDALYARDGSPERMNALKHTLIGDDDPLTAALRAGVADGSLRADVDPELTGLTLMTMLVGLSRRLAVAAPTFEAEFGRSIATIYREACRVIMAGLRRNDAPDDCASMAEQP